MGTTGRKNAPGAGRPPIPFDPRKFEAMCAISCTKDEIASVLGMSEETLENKVHENYGTNFSAIYKQYQGTGKQSLRRMQFQAAKKGNVTMLIWLGKQWLGQRDHSDDIGIDRPPINININGEHAKVDLDTTKNDNLEISRGSD